MASGNAPGRWGLLLTLSLLTACASSPQTRQLVADPPAVSAQVELSAVPFYPQQEFHCGPASLAAIVNYRGIASHPDEIARMVYVPDLKGSLQVEISAATRQLGLLAVQTDGRLESLLLELDAGNPVFVLQNLGLDSIPVWHYEVLIGYDLEQRQMLLRSGLNRRISRSFSLFEKTWQRADHWALVVIGPDAIPATASAEAYLAAVIDMEQVGRLDRAREGYFTALGRWPQNTLALAGLGNSSYALGDFPGAASAYRRALAIEPDNAGLWNNLAYALAQLGQREESLRAISEALLLDPRNAEYRSSHEEITNWPG